MTKLPAERIIDVLDRSARAWSRGMASQRPAIVRAIADRTAYSEPVVAYALDRLFGGITSRALHATIESELGSVAALDDFAARAGRPDVRYVPYGTVAIVASDTTIGVAIPALCFALCAGASVTIKERDDELVRAFVATIEEGEPALAERVRTAHWSSGDREANAAHVRDAAVVVAFGNDAALAAIRTATPLEARFIGFGHRTSVGYVAREALASEAAHGIALAIARDALLFDGDGCLSIHVAFVERGGAVDPRGFAALVLRAADEIARTFPAAGAPSAAVAAYRSAARFRASQRAGELFESASGSHLIAYDPPRGEPPPLLPRVLALLPVDGPRDAREYLALHALPLEGFALATGPRARADLDALALESGASRIAAFGTLQDPPLAGEHGGEPRIAPFVRAIYRG